jgi:hypothetical protein
MLRCYVKKTPKKPIEVFTAMIKQKITTKPKPKPKPKPWVSTTALAAELGCCTDTLHRMRVRGQLKRGVHWRIVNPDSQRLTYRWHTASCKKVLGGE